MARVPRPEPLAMRRYKEPLLQRTYDAYVSAHEAGRTRHADGRRRIGGTADSYFWKGYDRKTRRDRRPLGTQGSFARVAYMAGRDCRDREEN